MKKIRVLIVLISAFSAGAAFGQEGTRQDWMMSGINMRPNEQYPYGGVNSCEEVRKLKSSLDLNTVTIRKNLILSTYDSSNVINPDHDGSNDLEIRREFLHDRKLGVKSFFQLGLRLQSDLNAPLDQDDCSQNWHPWHGSIDFGSASEYDSFFYQYGQYLLHYADLARKSGNVSVFSIGHELFSLANTKQLKEAVEIRDYINGLDWNIRRNGKEANAYAQEEVFHLLSFNESLRVREGLETATISATPSDNRSLTEMVGDALKTDYALATAFFTHPAPTDNPNADLSELRRWVNAGTTYELPQNAKNYLITLENTRRAYLEGMWEKMIGEVKDKFADLPSGKRPLITFNGSASDQIGFWDKLDIISVSMYGSLGSIDPKDYTSIDDGKISVNDLKRGWMRYIDHVQDPNPYHQDPLQTGLKQFMANHPDKKVFFSELGFNHRQHSVQDSYLWSGCQTLERPDGTKFTVHALKRPLSNIERDNALEALRELLQEGTLPWLNGIVMWDAYTHPGSGTDEFCIDCPVPGSNSFKTGPYVQAISNLFRTESNKANNISTVDVCKPAPKPGAQSPASDGTLPDFEDLGISALDGQDINPPVEIPMRLEVEPAPRETAQ